LPALKETEPGKEDFLLGESHAIMRYICDSRGLDKYYPKDMKKRAKVNEYLDSHHSDMRATLTGYIF